MTVSFTALCVYTRTEFTVSAQIVEADPIPQQDEGHSFLATEIRATYLVLDGKLISTSVRLFGHHIYRENVGPAGELNLTGKQCPGWVATFVESNTP